MLTAALTTLALAAAVAASPAPSSQNGAPGCVGLANGVGNVKKFTLEAYIDGTQKTTPLALVRMTPSLLLSFIVTSDVGTEFTMLNSGVSSVDGGTVSEPVSSGNFLEFISFTSQSPAEVYCSVPSTYGSQYPGSLLAVNGTTEKFYLCPGVRGGPEDVVYDTPTTSGCVHAHIVINKVQ